MNKTIILMAHTASGKDTAIKYMSKKYNIPMSISNTSRPIRKNETQGVEYNFMSKEEFSIYDYPIPPRVYHTTKGDWFYGTDPNVENKIVILDFKGCQSLCDYLGRENIEVIKLKIDDKILLQRIKNRGDDEKEFIRRITDDKIKFEGSDEFADYIIENNGSIEEFYEKIDSVMGKILN